MRGTPVPGWLKFAVEAAIEVYPNGLLRSIAAASGGTSSSSPLCVKYIEPAWAQVYNTAGKQLRISTNSAFTWGTGTYVVPVAFPLSSAIFGRVGIVSSFDPAGWQVFDATSRSNEDLYLEWARRQGMARRAQLTAHTSLYNQQLRDTFRSSFKIDCVLFRPDQYNRTYTDARRDVWMNVTDWTPTGDIARDWSTRLINPKICIIIEEEFVDDRGGLVRRGLLNLTPPHLRSNPSTHDIVQAYHNDEIVRVPA
jgi:hypothetical protein